jgi:predicted metal-dependent hydrolase
MVTQQINLGDFNADVMLKGIKNVHLSVMPPTGHVRISAPERMSLDTIRVYAISKLGWIKDQQRKLRAQDRETPREYLEAESHYVWGKRRQLTIIETDKPSHIELTHKAIQLHVRVGTDELKRQAILETWYRNQLREAAMPLIAKWESIIDVTVADLFIRRMKTKWGSCNHAACTIRLNTDLAKKPPECLEYLVVHEMIHIHEPTHNARFRSLMDLHLPNWEHLRQRLNELPVRHETWGY